MKKRDFHADVFAQRHIGPTEHEVNEMLATIGVDSLEALIDQTIPENIRKREDLDLPKALSEYDYLRLMEDHASQNARFKSYIGLGYHNTITPPVLRRNIFENPGWYTQYTPYQAEIAQGRLEALLNFQTMVSDLTGFPIANASLLDEGTAAAEAMIMFFNAKNKREIVSRKFFVSENCLPQTIQVLESRANALGIELVIGNEDNQEFDDTFFGVLLQYPKSNGHICDYNDVIQRAKDANLFVCLSADILALTLLKSPMDLGADCAVGTTQRFGVPMGYGGPHAAYFATIDKFKRNIPGRIIGVSIDRNGNPALRMALQTREQHIKREKATSNICTAQALLAIMAGMYASWHGFEGLQGIAFKVHSLTAQLANSLKSANLNIQHSEYFDTLFINLSSEEITKVAEVAKAEKVNFRLEENGLGITLDETTNEEDVLQICSIFSRALNTKITASSDTEAAIPANLLRDDRPLEHPVFNDYRSETQMMRYIKQLENRDLSLTQSMIPLGSCTMKLNSVSELEPVSWPSFAHIHPFAPIDQTTGYQKIIEELSEYLCKITDFTACSLQPNSGAQGEFTGLMVIRAYHKFHGNDGRKIVLIPASAHGTNPASAIMAGCKVVVVACDSYGNIDFDDLKEKAEQYKTELCGLMVTYPSTHGVFEHRIKDICEIIHENGGLVYMDGANMNAQVGLTSPGSIGADVCHLNLHKTFSIPHGGGGPGMGPICVNDKLAPFLPSNPVIPTGGSEPIPAVSAAPWGSASILLISYGYIRMLGQQGVKRASEIAILNANYIKARLSNDYDVLYVGKENHHVAHELILDLRPYKHSHGLDVEDIAKRLIDYGFHAPTVSFPVPGTIMIEPTESEDKAEMDRFCEAMLKIKVEIDNLNVDDPGASPLKNAPHVVEEVVNDEWNYPYSRKEAAFPLPYVVKNKFWPAVARVNNSHGDRNLICTCPPISAYEETMEVSHS